MFFLSRDKERWKPFLSSVWFEQILFGYKFDEKNLENERSKIMLLNFYIVILHVPSSESYHIFVVQVSSGVQVCCIDDSFPSPTVSPAGVESEDRRIN